MTNVTPIRRAFVGLTATHGWLEALAQIKQKGAAIAPRGKSTLEVPQRTDIISMRHPLMLVPRRALSYRFCAAEAFWILSGSDRLDMIAPYNARMAEFSDDGIHLFGAYGPPITDQLSYVVEKLTKDESSRQAGLTIWRQKPPDTKDPPCTIAMWFMVRDDRLNMHVYMRSNDVWLGWPYDVFSFTMVAHAVCCRLNRAPGRLAVIEPGALFLTAASSHLYAENLEGVAYVQADIHPPGSQSKTPTELYTDEDVLMATLKALRDSVPGSPLRWWEQP